MIEFLSVRGMISVQDGGRFGRQNEGLAPGGAFDLPSLKAANLLAGNAPEAAALEILGAGLTALVRVSLPMGFAGHPRPLHADGHPLPFYTTLWVKAGTVLDLADGPGQHVVWALGGGAYAPLRHGSRSETPTLPQLGWYQPKRAHTVICTVKPPPPRPGRVLQLDPADWPPFGPPWNLRVVPGPDWDRFPADKTALPREIRVAAAGRMGIRASGDPVYPRPIRLGTRGTVAGAIEVDASGTAMLLGPERQTTGGYPVPWVIVPEDLGVLAELAPGAVVRLIPADGARREAP